MKIRAQSIGPVKILFKRACGATKLRYPMFETALVGAATAMDKFDTEEFEFLEFQNTGDDSLDLAAVTIGSGISFDFAASDVLELGAGEFVVVVRNLAVFSTGHDAASVRIASEWRRHPSNSAEGISFTGPPGDNGSGIRVLGRLVSGNRRIRILARDRGPHPASRNRELVLQLSPRHRSVWLSRRGGPFQQCPAR